MRCSDLIVTTLSLLFGLSLGSNERFEIKEVNTLEAPKYDKSMLNPAWPYPFLLGTVMRMPEDTGQAYSIRTTIVPNASEDGKVLSVVYTSDYDGYGDIRTFTIEEGASEAGPTSRRQANGKWRIRFFPRNQDPDDVPIDFLLEDPQGRVYFGREKLKCEPTPNYGGFYCVKRVVPLTRIGRGS